MEDIDVAVEDMLKTYVKSAVDSFPDKWPEPPYRWEMLVDEHEKNRLQSSTYIKTQLQKPSDLYPNRFGRIFEINLVVGSGDMQSGEVGLLLFIGDNDEASAHSDPIPIGDPNLEDEIKKEVHRLLRLMKP
jgi:hypothetical protein